MSIRSNPFYILKCTPSDTREIISQKAEDEILDGLMSESIIRDAEKKLFSPNSRISSMIGYLLEPVDLSYEKIISLSEMVSREGISFCPDDTSLPATCLIKDERSTLSPISELNLIITWLEQNTNATLKHRDVADGIVYLCILLSKLQCRWLASIISEKNKESGFSGDVNSVLPIEFKKMLSQAISVITWKMNDIFSDAEVYRRFVSQLNTLLMNNRITADNTIFSAVMKKVESIQRAEAGQQCFNPLMNLFDSYAPEMPSEGRPAAISADAIQKTVELYQHIMQPIRLWKRLQGFPLKEDEAIVDLLLAFSTIAKGNNNTTETIQKLDGMLDEFALDTGLSTLVESGRKNSNDIVRRIKSAENIINLNENVHPREMDAGTVVYIVVGIIIALIFIVLIASF